MINAILPTRIIYRNQNLKFVHKKTEVCKMDNFFILKTGVTVYLVPPGILSLGTLYPGVKCPTVPPILSPLLKLMIYLFFFYNFYSGTYFIA